MSGKPVIFGLVLTTALFWASTSMAFHDGGVASCQFCHVMHESRDGQMVIADEDLLIAESATDVCLTCHASSNGAVFGTDPLSPSLELGGGNFIFLLEDDIYDGPGGGGGSVIAGEASGHSIVAPSVGLMPDSRFLTAPGGSFPSTNLSCTSCHDPHGNTNFRMLRGAGPVQGGSFYFNADAPLADGVPLSGGAESSTHHTAYRGGWTQWCGNCHSPQYHDLGISGFQHPVGEQIGPDIAVNYDVYLGEANPTGGVHINAYLPEVAFEDMSMTTSSSSGPTSGSYITCVTCHRVHGSSAPSAGRWDFLVRELGDDGSRSGSYPLPNPYSDPNQRQLCLKCHHGESQHQNRKLCLNCHGSGGGGASPPIVSDPAAQ